MSTDVQIQSPPTFDVFISYARADREPVERLVQGLKRDGIKVWFDVEQMSGGHTTMSALAEGIARSAHLIACLSDSYLGRDFTTFELQVNQAMDPANLIPRTILVEIAPRRKEIPPELGFVTRGDLTNPGTYDSEYARIIKLIRETKPKSVPTQVDRESLRRSCGSPFSHLDEPSVALFQAHVATDVICRFLYRQELGEPPASSTLDSLVPKLLAITKFPQLIKASLSTVQMYGNVVTDQKEKCNITKESIQPGLAALRVLSDWVQATYFGQPQKRDLWESVLAELPKCQPNEREIPPSNYILTAPRLSLNSLGPLFSGRDKRWGRAVTINLVSLSEREEDVFFEEVARFIQLNDPSIVRPLDATRVTVNGKRLCLAVILENVDGASAQDLVERFGKLPELAACELCRGVAVSLSALHSGGRPIVHGDIKPANIIVDRYGTIKILCVGRNVAVTAEDASSGAAGGKLDSFLFCSPEKFSGVKNLTAVTDLFALRATLFYLLTGQYEGRLPEVVVVASFSRPLQDVLDKLANCRTAEEARVLLDEACKRLTEGGETLRAVIDCYRDNRKLGESPAKKEGPTRLQPTEFSLSTELSAEVRNAWPLGAARVLAWENGAETLSILEGTDRLWRDSQPMRLRSVSRGPEDHLAAIGWEGHVRCFAAGELVVAAALPGAIGDAEFSGGRWIIGDWKQSLVSVAPGGGISPLLEVANGVFRIAVMDGAEWFAVADLSGGIALYSGDRRRVAIPPLPNLSGMAFAGSRLVVLSGQSLISIDLNGQIVGTEAQPGGGRARLLPAPGRNQCLLLAQNGHSWIIDQTGAHIPYFTFPPSHGRLVCCAIPKRFVLGLPGSGYAYWRNGQSYQSWPDAIGASLSWDGHFLAVTFPGVIRLYEDPK